jgi:exodeoxyribonuclease VII large subunit
MAEIGFYPANAAEITVSELSSALKRTLEDRFGFVRVRGEVSGYKGPHTSGHAYFSLKDAGARLDAVIWKPTFLRMRVKPEDGLEVIATGKITNFAGKSSYQIIVDVIEPAGVGALMALLEARRRQLAAEGMFDNSRKRSLPYLPRVVGVVTSSSGSVIRDILHRLADRFPVRVVLWPVRVQGETAGPEIVAAIRGFNELTDESAIPRPDVLIVARGGGSLEDLWSFNEEIVVRVAAASEIPLVSAVGHETDWTLIDHAADLRAPTPTAAAEFCVPVRSDLIARATSLDARMMGALSRLTQRNRTHLRTLLRGLPESATVSSVPNQRLDVVVENLKSTLRSRIIGGRLKVTEIARRLARFAPHVQLARASERTDALTSRLAYFGNSPSSKARVMYIRVHSDLMRAIRMDFGRRKEKLIQTNGRWASKSLDIARSRSVRKTELSQARERLSRAVAGSLNQKLAGITSLFQLFEAVNYRAVLARGFALVQDQSGTPITRAEAARIVEDLRIRFSDGEIAARVVGRPRAPKHRRLASMETNQPRLL